MYVTLFYENTLAIYVGGMHYFRKFQQLHFDGAKVSKTKYNGPMYLMGHISIFPSV